MRRVVLEHGGAASALSACRAAPRHTPVAVSAVRVLECLCESAHPGGVRDNEVVLQCSAPFCASAARAVLAVLAAHDGASEPRRACAAALDAALRAAPEAAEAAVRSADEPIAGGTIARLVADCPQLAMCRSRDGAELDELLGALADGIKTGTAIKAIAERFGLEVPPGGGRGRGDVVSVMSVVRWDQE